MNLDSVTKIPVPIKNSIQLPKMRALAPTIVFACLLVFGSSAALGQSNQEKFDEIMSTWKEAGKTAASAANKYYFAERADASVHRKEWQAAIDQGNLQKELIVPVAIALYSEQSEPTSELSQLLIRIMQSMHDEGRYEKAFEISELLIDKNPSDENLLLLRMSSAAFTDRFRIAKAIYDEHPLLREKLIREASAILIQAEELAKAFDNELEIRKKEAEADDLPRAKIKTTKGTIVIELFENEAPDTVGNFIFIVQNMAYKDFVFHRVLNHFMAQTGGFHVSGKRFEVGYNIYDECQKPEARNHFRGSLSMAKTQEPDSGNSQFFITFKATPNLNGKHTVFGRVISGWDALDSLTRTHTISEEKMEETPIEGISIDRILSVTIERKRDHPYKPDRVEQE